MDEPQAAKAAADAAPTIQTAIALLLTGAGGFLAKHVWDRRRPVRAGVTHAEIAELKDLLESLRVGQDQRGQQMAVMQATMASKEDLAEGVQKMADHARVMVEAVHSRVNEHLRDHSKAA